MWIHCLIAVELKSNLIRIISFAGYTYPTWYQCDPAICKVPNCRCASTNPPVPLEEAPQFVVISNDDGVRQLFLYFFTSTPPL